MAKKSIGQEKVKNEIEKSLKDTGFKSKIGKNKITLYPNKLTEKSSQILKFIRNFYSQNLNLIKTPRQKEQLNHYFINKINRILTPIKFRIIGNIILDLIFIVTLSCMLKHIWNHFFSIIAVSVFIALILFMGAVIIKLLFALTKSDHQILLSRKFVESHEGYEIAYNTYFRELKNKKCWDIIFSFILLILFFVGIIFHVGILNYISVVSDSLGYIFAIMFLSLSNLNHPNSRKGSIAFLLPLFALFVVKNIINSYILNVFFLFLDVIIYILFFIYSWYDVLTFKDR